MSRRTVLIVESEWVLRRRMRLALGSYCDAVETGTERDVSQFLYDKAPALVIVGECEEGCEACLRSVQLVRQSDKTVPIILVAKKSSEDLAIAALRAGVTDYIKHPFPDDKIVEAFRHVMAPTKCQQRSASEPRSELFVDGQRMIGDSPPMRHVKEYVQKVAATNCNVLITGETGTGKELVAELIHSNSPRRDKRFICVNCAAIPDALLESELFGYEPGAFTGALRRHEGKLRLAGGGTVFFDEIGDMSLQGQAKILRAIENRQVQRLGAVEDLRLDIRILAATNRDEASLAKGEGFRKDLFFRLNVAHIHLPPLRDRKIDIPELLDFYRKSLNALLQCEVNGFSQEVLQLFLHYAWPGNIRELKNTVEAVLLNSPSPWIRFEDLPEQIRRRLSDHDRVADNESDRVLSALLETNWNKSKAAQKLHWSRMTLYRKLAKYHIVGGAN